MGGLVLVRLDFIHDVPIGHCVRAPVIKSGYRVFMAQRADASCLFACERVKAWCCRCQRCEFINNGASTAARQEIARFIGIADCQGCCGKSIAFFTVRQHDNSNGDCRAIKNGGVSAGIEHLINIAAFVCSGAIGSCDAYSLIHDAGVKKRSSICPICVHSYAIDAVECGFCNPGMIMNAIALFRENPEPTDDEIKRYLAGNLCRCSGYEGQLRGIHAFMEYRKQGGAACE